MIAKTKRLLISSAILTSLFVNSVGHAADLVASSISPSVTFIDSTIADGDDWRIFGAQFANGTGILSAIDNLGSNNHRVFGFAGTPGSTNNLNSLAVDSAGDINLADGAVFIDRSSGRVGIGTTSPETDLHIGGNGNIILESSLAKWTIDTLLDGGIWLSNRMDTNPTFPFRIDAAAPNHSIRVGSVGVGIGTLSPTAKLDVAGDIKTTFTGSNNSGLQQLFVMSANNSNVSQRSDAGFVMENAREGFSWAFRTDEDNQGFSASKQATGAREFELRNTTNVASNVQLHLANGARNVNGQWLNASSRSYKKNIHELSDVDAMKALNELKSVTYEFKGDKK